MGFSNIDYTLLFVYLFGVTMFGAWLGRKQRDTTDYFLGGRNLPWGAVCFSVVATETSTLTFISIPGLAYATNLNFLQLTIGYLAGRIIISFVLLPAYYRGQLFTAYEYLGQRFGQHIRNFASVVFQLTRLLADGVRLFATAIPLKVITGWDYPLCIAIIGVATVIYTYIGGIRAVVWMDVIQMTIYVGGAVGAGFLLLNKIDGGWSSVFAAAAPAGKLQILNTGFDLPLREFFATKYTVISGLLGGAFLSMASHGTDQLIVQRLLTCRNLRSSQKALIGSGVLVIVQFALFLVIGLMLFAYYKGQTMDSDVVFPQFVVNNLPIGLAGIVSAGIFAAAMSTLSSSLNSLASSTVLDLIKPRYGSRSSPTTELLISRLATVCWGLVLVGVAMVFRDKQNPVVELGLAIASFTYGGLLGAFFLGIFISRARERDALVAMWTALAFMTWFVGVPGQLRWLVIVLLLVSGGWVFTRLTHHLERLVLLGILTTCTILLTVATPPQLAWPWYVPVGTSVTLLIGSLLSRLSRSSARPM